MKKLLMVLTGIILLSLVLAGTISVTLNTPTNNNYVLGNNVIFNATGTSTASLVNVSLFENMSTGTWIRNETVTFGLFPPFTNQTGFSLASIGSGEARGVTRNSTNFLIIDAADKWVYCTDLVGNNLTCGFSTTVAFTSNPTDIAFKDSTTLLILQASGGTKSGIVEVSTSGVNLTTGYIDLLADSFVNPKFDTIDGNNVWVADANYYWVNHYLNGVNQTDGFGLSSVGYSGFALSARDIYLAKNNFMAHYKTDGTNQSDGFSTATFGISAPNGIDSYEDSLYVIDTADDWLYNLKGISSLNNGIFKKNITQSGIWNVEYCDSDGDCGMSANNYTLNILGYENSQVYSDSTIGTSIEYFYLNLSYDSSAYLSLGGTLVYNNTNYVVNPTLVSGGAIFNKSISIPAVSATTNISFFWNLSFSEGSNTYYATTNYKNQSVSTIKSINITNMSCSAGFFETINYTFYNEENLTKLNNAYLKYNFKYGLGNSTTNEIYGENANTNILRVCINNTYNTYKLGYGEIEYSSTDYVTRTYYMFSNTTLSNSSTKEFKLYDLPTELSTSFIFVAKDYSLNPYSNAYISLFRWYPQLNEYRPVERGRTDSTGQTVMKVNTEDVDYRVALHYENGSMIQMNNPVRMACLATPCTYSFRVETATQGYFYVYGIQSNLSWDETNRRFIYIWNDPSQTVYSMTLQVDKDEGYRVTNICNNTGYGYTGVLTCDIGYVNGTYIAKVIKTASPWTVYAEMIKSFGESVVSDFGYLVGFFLVLTTALIGVFSPVGAIIFSILGIIPAMAFGVLSWAGVAGVIFMGIIVIYLIDKAKDR